MDGPSVREAVAVVDRSDQHLSQPFAGLLSALGSRSEIDNLGRVGSHQSRLHSMVLSGVWQDLWIALNGGRASTSSQWV